MCITNFSSDKLVMVDKRITDCYIENSFIVKSVTGEIFANCLLVFLTSLLPIMFREYPCLLQITFSEIFVLVLNELWLSLGKVKKYQRQALIGP